MAHIPARQTRRLSRACPWRSQCGGSREPAQWRWITDAQETADSYVKDLRDAIMARIAYDEAVAKSTARLTLVEPDPNWHDFVIPAEDPGAVLSETDASRESEGSARETAKRSPPPSPNIS